MAPTKWEVRRWGALRSPHHWGQGSGQACTWGAHPQPGHLSASKFKTGDGRWVGDGQSPSPGGRPARPRRPEGQMPLTEDANPRHAPQQGGTGRRHVLSPRHSRQMGETSSCAMVSVLWPEPCRRRPCCRALEESSVFRRLTGAMTGCGEWQAVCGLLVGAGGKEQGWGKKGQDN